MLPALEMQGEGRAPKDVCGSQSWKGQGDGFTSRAFQEESRHVSTLILASDLQNCFILDEFE